MGRRALDQTEALRQCREANAEKDDEIERLQAGLTEIRDSTFRNSVQLRAMAQRLLETKTPPPAAAEMTDHEVRETGETTCG
ncbi:MAG: hypothetical protein RIA64_07545 [Rhodospirillales bacterium]